MNLRLSPHLTSPHLTSPTVATSGHKWLQVVTSGFMWLKVVLCGFIGKWGKVAKSDEKW